MVHRDWIGLNIHESNTKSSARYLPDIDHMHMQAAMYQAQPSQRQVTNQEVERSVVRTHLFLCCGPRFGPDTIKTKEKSFRIDNRNSAGADGGPRSRACACWTLRSAPHRHQQKCLVHVSAHPPFVQPNQA